MLLLYLFYDIETVFFVRHSNVSEALYWLLLLFIIVPGWALVKLQTKKNIYVKTSEFILVIGKTSFFYLWTIQNAFNDFNWKAQKVIKFKSPFNCLKLFVSHTDYCFLLTHYYLVSNLPSQNPMISFTRKPLAIMMLMLLQFFIISIYFIIIDI